MLTKAVNPHAHQGDVGQAQWATAVGKGLLEMEVKGIKQDLIQYVGQLECASVPIEGWVIDPDVYGLLGGSCDVYIPTNS